MDGCNLYAQFVYFNFSQHVRTHTWLAGTLHNAAAVPLLRTGNIIIQENVENVSDWNLQ